MVHAGFHQHRTSRVASIHQIHQLHHNNKCWHKEVHLINDLCKQSSSARRYDVCIGRVWESTLRLLDVVAVHWVVEVADVTMQVDIKVAVDSFDVLLLPVNVAA